MNTKQVLKESFGYDCFKGDQDEIIKSVMDGKDTIVLMPTGGGKSLCYQIPGIMLDGLTIVISPLIALMQDQVDALVKKNIGAAFYNSTQSEFEKNDIIKAIEADEITFLYVAPEALFSYGFLDRLSGIEVSLIAIDEAHCIDQWGHDFRSDYLRLSEIFAEFPKAKKIALTATATKETRKSIHDNLKFKNCNMFVSPFDRSNIFYFVEKKGNSNHQMMEAIKLHESGSSGIIFCLSRKKVESTYEFLKSNGYKALPYHAGIPMDARENNQKRFLDGECDIMVATIAFGMGVDKSNVRFVIHMDIPSTMEGYYQETGRAGRDGKPSSAYLFYGEHDIQARIDMVKSSKLSEVEKLNRINKIDFVIGYADTSYCKRKMMLRYFNDALNAKCGGCSSCNNEVETIDVTVNAQMFLSTVIRGGTCFSLTVNILMGKMTELICNGGLSSLPSFGIGKDTSKKSWMFIYRQLLSMKAVDDNQIGMLAVNDFGKSIMRGKVKFTVPKSLDKSIKLDPKSQKLFDDFKVLRGKIAVRKKIPPYQILDDKDIMNIIVKRPKTEEDLCWIVGNIKGPKYSKDILGLLNKKD